MTLAEISSNTIMRKSCQCDAAPPDHSVRKAAPEGHPPRRSYARWRALSLSLVYVVFGIHIIHWKITGKTLAPLELNQIRRGFYTPELRRSRRFMIGPDSF